MTIAGRARDLKKNWRLHLERGTHVVRKLLPEGFGMAMEAVVMRMQHGYMVVTDG